MKSSTIREVIEKVILDTKWQRKIIFLTGAGISAESGVPTYRGTEGYWVKGSRNYRPEEIGTLKFFQQHPEEVWHFTLFRKGIFQQAMPNNGHYAIATIEKHLGNRFHLITQNIDGLHFRAGTSQERTYQIHGSLDFMRCSRECSKQLYPFPNLTKTVEGTITEQDWQLLTCPACGHMTRPNILWFDERYNERLFKLDSALKVAKHTGLMVIVGTSGATNLPNQLVAQTLKYGGAIVDINMEENHFSQLAQTKKNGYVIRGNSSEILPEIETIIKELLR